ncbi:MAG TPA: hypothetical protein VLZ06_02515 [Solirubrobacteraceae bacterium]|nr:hypothetical protein [Solirubrobacteraceae bacterium]
MKHPARFLVLAAVALLTVLGVAACGGSSSSSSSSASVGTSSKTSGSTAAGGSTTGSASARTTGTSGTTGSTKPDEANRRVKKATRAKGSKVKRRVAAGRVKSATLRRCLEQNGVKPGSSKSKGAARGQLAAALKRCGRTALPRPPKRSSALRRQLLTRPAYRKALVRFTHCMRTHGVPSFPEPNTSGNGPLFPAGRAKPTPQLRAAQRACIGQLSLR